MNVLLIDGKSSSLTQLNELFKEKACDTTYFKDPIVALKSFSKHKFDVVICADDIHKTSAFNFLKAVSIKYPTIIRAAFTDNRENNPVDKISHYVFESTIDNKEIVATITALETSKKAITKKVIVKAVASVKTLPTPPKVYMQLNAVLKNNNSDSEKIAEIISQDPSLVAKVLQFSNTAFLPNGKKLTNITEAITKMGVETLSCIVMTAEMFSYEPDIPNFSLQEEQLHSLATARFAASMVDKELKHDALLAGLLHDIGKLVLFEIDKALTLKYFDNNARTSSDIILEQRIFTTDHCQIGAYLLHVWSFPYDIIDSVLNHHTPSKLLTKRIGAAQAVYIANSLLKDEELDRKFVEHYNLADKMDKLKKSASNFK
jgi:putative nucleotidyltransferase with HDIG domain